ncbi:MAG: NifU N-terminal domain-containing protein [Actinomycetota bacterium]|nr:NifU N-terminal domain-containing protein [Actinomycetota bacterium]
MGQPITVVEKPATRPGVVRFELNRSLTGMGHERYRSVADATGDRPPDEMARRLFRHPGVEAVHVYSNVVTVEVGGAVDSGALRDSIEELFIHYTPGVTPSIP